MVIIIFNFYSANEKLKNQVFVHSYQNNLNNYTK